MKTAKSILIDRDRPVDGHVLTDAQLSYCYSQRARFARYRREPSWLTRIVYPGDRTASWPPALPDFFLSRAMTLF
jgi:hypothetical protein